MEFPLEEFDNFIDKYFGEKDPPVYDLKKEEGPCKLFYPSVETAKDENKLFDQEGKWSKTEVILPLASKELFHLFLNSDKLVAKAPMMKDFYELDADVENCTDVKFALMKIPIPLVANRYNVCRRRWKKLENGFIVGEKSIVNEEEYKEKLKIGKKDVKLLSIRIRKYEEMEGGKTKATTYNATLMGGNLDKLSKLGGMDKMMMKMMAKEIPMVVDWNEKLSVSKEDEKVEKEEKEESESESEEEDEGEGEENDN